MAERQGSPGPRVDHRSSPRSNADHDTMDIDHEMRNEWDYVQYQQDHSRTTSHRRLQSGTTDEDWHDCISSYNDDGIVGQSEAIHGNSYHHKNFLTVLPYEIIAHILSFLSPFELTISSRTCRALRNHTFSDTLWQTHVNSNLPLSPLSSPAPYATFRELYAAHDPHWFLPKHKIWFSDFFLTGKLILIRYDPRRSVIEGYRLVAERPIGTFETWDHDDEVVIHSFDPKCRLHLDEPVLHLNAKAVTSTTSKWEPETPMPLHPPTQRTVFSNFLLTRAVEQRPNMALWPPPQIPDMPRVRNASQEGFSGSGHKPSRREEICDTAFRIRRWIQMSNPRGRAPGVHMGEEISTFSTLDPKLYTPTEDKPFRGIWVGDYSGHGCEFLLMHQPDDVEPFNDSTIPARREDESLEAYERRARDAKMFRGRLEAVKLTGDPNIPRGELTFVAEDIGEDGLVRVAEEAPFKGARIVRSQGHIAQRMFLDDTYIPSQLILISPNRLAQYWLDWGHISYFERVDIVSLLTPPAASPSSTTQPSDLPTNSLNTTD